MRRHSLFLLAVFLGVLLTETSAPVSAAPDSARPGTRVLMDAHNCYPYFEWWSDRIDRALSTGRPLAIEQDLVWHTDPRTGRPRSLLSHGAAVTGAEPGMREYFFERVRPVVEKALRAGNHGDWPLITLNLDLKSEEPEHLQAIWELLSEYQAWLTTARRSADIAHREPLAVGPILVLTGESEAQKQVFYDQVPEGGRLLVFGAVVTSTGNPGAPPEVAAPGPADNYRRWWNNSWHVVEAAGQPSAGEWTAAKEARLDELVRYAHAHDLWIRFYTLDGAPARDLSCYGWFRGYNFGSKKAVLERWAAAAKAGADFIASDQYEDLAAFLKTRAVHPSAAPRARR